MVRLFSSMKSALENREAAKLKRQAIEQYEAYLNHSGTPTALHDAVEAMKYAVGLAPEDENSLEYMGVMLITRYEVTSNLQDLKDGLDFLRHALQMTPEKKRINRARRKRRLARCMLYLYNRGMGGEHLEEGLDLTRDALQLLPEKHPERESVLNLRGELLFSQYQRLRRIGDLHASNLCFVDATTAKSQEAHLFRGRLSRNYYLMYERTKDVQYETRAIELAQLWLEEDVQDYQDQKLHVMALHLLGSMLHGRYKRTHDMKDLRKSITYTRNAAWMTSRSGLLRPPRLHDLAESLFDLFNCTLEMKHLDEAIEHTRTAVALVEGKNASCGQWLFNLGAMYRRRYEVAGDPADSDSAIRYYIRSSKSVGSNSFVRVAGARRGIELLCETGDWWRASSLAQDTLSLLTIICSRFKSREDQQYAISEAAGFAADACSVALRAGRGRLERESALEDKRWGLVPIIPDAAMALQSLEQGRGLILGYIIDTKSGVGELPSERRYLAEHFNRLIDKIAALDTSADKDVPEKMPQWSMERRLAEHEATAFLADIRSLDGCGRFLLPLSAGDMITLAAEGPIVVVNVTDFGSDALIVHSSGIRPIPLPELQGPRLELYRGYGLVRGGMMRDAKVIEDDDAAGDMFPQYLAWLWDVCVRLVLEELRLCSPQVQAQISQGHLPRVWWIGTGGAHSLPFHAAGIHTRGSTENTFSHVISSYVPTLKALHHARQAAVCHPEEHSMLIVSMPETPTLRSLPEVKEERKAIKRALQSTGSKRPNELDLPSPETVLETLRDCTMIHFACHGQSDLVDPSNSALLLQGSSSASPARLTVSAISRANLGRAWLAYLSACSTAETKAPSLADEALHLASGFQVAGFRHVIASMWPSNDTICARVAEHFYQYLMDGTGGVMDDYRVAWALHMAVNEIRSCTYLGVPLTEQPALWAQYIHFGA